MSEIFIYILILDQDSLNSVIVLVKNKLYTSIVLCDHFYIINALSIFVTAMTVIFTFI